MLSFVKTGLPAALLMACTMLLAAILFIGCQTGPKAPTLELSWEQNQGTWNLGAGAAPMDMMVKNLTDKDQWVTLMAFENDCFKFEGFGPKVRDWANVGKIPPDGKEHAVKVLFTPLAECPGTEYHFFVESRTDPVDKIPQVNFATTDTLHAGSKTFRVSIVRVVEMLMPEATPPADEPETLPDTGQE